jgi:hypothetical protein
LVVGQRVEFAVSERFPGRFRAVFKCGVCH